MISKRRILLASPMPRRFENLAQALEEAADEGDHDSIQAAFKELGKSCGGCHKPFRKPKEESYKKR